MADTWDTDRLHTTAWHVNLIKCVDSSLYAGISTNVAARYEKHCNGKGTRCTHAKLPKRLVGSKPCSTRRSDAQKAEYAIRRLDRSKKIAAIQA
jgi:putative endonuclease